MQVTVLLKSITIILILITQEVVSQELTARVLALRGNNTYLNTKEKIKTGDLLHLDDTIKLVKGGYLGMMLSNGRAFELFGPGIQKMSDYLFDPKTKENPCMKIWRENGYFDPLQGDSEIMVNDAMDYPIQLKMAENHRTINVYPSMIRMDFEIPMTMDSLRVTYYNICDEVINSLVTDENFVITDISTLNLSKIYDDFILFNVTAYNNELEYISPTYGLLILDENQIREIESNLLNMPTKEQRYVYFMHELLPLNASYELHGN